MLHDRRIIEIAERVAKAQIPGTGLERIVSEPATDSEGNEALRITVILKPETAEALTGDSALDLLVGLQNALRGEGEERFPIVEYATEVEFGEADTDSAGEDEAEDDE
jgi:hypothetical protein